jgi:predicted nucleotidyltransferase
MNDSDPGSADHRRLLRAVVDHYRDDPRILAVLVFGSVARGNWHPRSDLDLDIVIADGLTLDTLQEVRTLCDSFASIGECAAIILPKRTDEADVVLASLRQLSLRYHPLRLTSPNIVDSMRLLWGHIDAGAIAAAGIARRQPADVDLHVLAGQCIRHLLEVDVALQRRELWSAVGLLQAAREDIVALYGAAREAPRPWHAFAATASPQLQENLGTTLPLYTADSLSASLRHCIALLTDDLDEIAGGRLALSEPEHAVLAAILRRRDADREPSG